MMEQEWIQVSDEMIAAFKEDITIFVKYCVNLFFYCCTIVTRRSTWSEKSLFQHLGLNSTDVFVRSCPSMGDRI